MKTTGKMFGDMFSVDFIDTLNVWRKMRQFLLKNVIFSAGTGKPSKI
jgi:hypothetical protein